MLEMPELHGAEYLTRFATDIGIASTSGFGMAPISWSEIQSWSELTGNRLNPFEAKTIMFLSRQFTRHYIRYDGSNDPSPFVDAIQDPVKVSESVGNFLRGLMRRKQNG